MSTQLFQKPAALVTFVAHDEITDGFAVIQDPRLSKYAGLQWIEGVHGQDAHGYVRGRRVLIALSSVTSITEFESTAEAYASRRRRRRR